MQGWEHKTYWEGENLVRRFSFDSIEDYLAYLESAPLQEPFEAGAASELGSEDFTGSRSLAHAIELARYGWHEGFSELVHMTEQVKRALDFSPEVSSTFHDYVGFVPDVKAFMEGSPLSMINAPAVRKPHINVYMNTSIDGFVDEADVYRRGAATLALCEVIETCGIMVDLHLFEMSFIDKDIALSEFVVKARDERINLAKLHFPICHPSWIRRLNFRLIEIMPNVTQAWAASYGIPADRRMMTEVLGLGPTDVLVPTVDEIGKMLKEPQVEGDGSEVVRVARCIAEFIYPALPPDKRFAFKAMPYEKGLSHA